MLENDKLNNAYHVQVVGVSALEDTRVEVTIYPLHLHPAAHWWWPILKTVVTLQNKTVTLQNVLRITVLPIGSKTTYH